MGCLLVEGSSLNAMATTSFDQMIFDTLTKTEKQLYVRFGCVLELTTAQLAEFMGYKVTTVQQLISQGTFPIPTYKRGRFRYASLAHVARFQEETECKAVAELSRTQSAIYGKAQGERVRAMYQAQ